MTIKELQQICQHGEHQFLEFKQYASEPDQITEEISGFLNAKGGNLMIGVKDDGTVTGLKFAEDDLVFLLDYIAKHINPRPLFSHEIIPVSRKRSVIHFSFEEGDKKPYGVTSDKSQGKKVYYRINDLCIKASRELKGILRGKPGQTGQTIIYSSLESAILRMVDEQERINKAELCDRLDYNSRLISDCLIRLVKAGVLSINPRINGDLYEFKQLS